MGDRSLTLYVEDETLTGLETLAHETDRSFQHLKEEAVRQYVEHEIWRADKIRQAVGRADAGDFATDEEMEAAFDRYRADAAG